MRNISVLNELPFAFFAKHDSGFLCFIYKLCGCCFPFCSQIIIRCQHQMYLSPYRSLFFFFNIKVLSIEHLVIYCPKLRKEAKQNSNSAHFWYQNRFQFSSCVTHGISFNTSELSLLIFKSNNTFYLVGLWKQSNRMLNIVPNTTYNKKC